MNVFECDKNFAKSLIDNGFLRYDDYIYKNKDNKFGGDNVGTINKLISHPNLEEEPILWLPDSIVLDEDTKEYIGTRIPVLKNYHELSDYLFYEKIFDKYKVLSDVAKGIEVLLKNGISYYDVHPYNIMINKDSDTKLIDIDGAEEVNNEDNFWALYNYIELIITTYFPKSFMNNEYILSFLLKDETLTSYFSREVLDYFIELYRVCNLENLNDAIYNITTIPYKRILDEVADRHEYINRKYLLA